MAAPHLTQSHLLNRILQRQISQLEVENATLKARVARLENRVTDSTAKQRAIQGSAADDISNATVECQSISRETERVAKLMVEQLRHPQNRLVEVVQDVRHEQTRLARAISEFHATLDSLPKHAKRDAAAVVRTAHARQESLLAQLAELYDAHGMLRHAESDSRLNARRIEGQATGYRRQLTAAIERDQQRHTARLAEAYDQARSLVQLLANCTEGITKLHGIIQKSSGGTANTGTPPLAKVAREERVAGVSATTPHQEEKVLETARRALEEERPTSAPATLPPKVSTPAVSRIQDDTDTIGTVPLWNVEMAPVRPRPYLQIALGLAVFVVFVVIVVTLM